MINLFSPFYVREHLGVEHDMLYNEYVPKMIDNYNNQPNLSPDWVVHTSYNLEDKLKNKIDWNLAMTVYSGKIRKFIRSYFNKELDWEFGGGLWYTVYGPGQMANIHDHIPEHFSLVHYIKFNPQLHWPISFINPMKDYIRLLLSTNQGIRDNLDYNNQNQSLFHPRFTPMVNEGDIIIFPSVLEHMVEKTYNDDLRITIALNFNIKK